jgi:hypothetical protein
MEHVLGIVGKSTVRVQHPVVNVNVRRKTSWAIDLSSRVDVHSIGASREECRKAEVLQTPLSKPHWPT